MNTFETNVLSSFIYSFYRGRVPKPRGNGTVHDAMWTAIAFKNSKLEERDAIFGIMWRSVFRAVKECGNARDRARFANYLAEVP